MTEEIEIERRQSKYRRGSELRFAGGKSSITVYQNTDWDTGQQSEVEFSCCLIYSNNIEGLELLRKAFAVALDEAKKIESGDWMADSDKARE